MKDEELGVKLAELALRFSVTGPAIGVAARRGRAIAERKGLKLARKKLFAFFNDVPGRPSAITRGVRQNDEM